MINLLRKSLLLLCLCVTTNALFSQGPPPPPPGPPQPLTIDNNTNELIIAIVFENNDCAATTNITTTWYTLYPGDVITVNFNITTTGSIPPYWLGVTTFLWPTMPAIPTLKGNPFTSCVTLTDTQGPGQPSINWMSAYSLEIY